MGRRSGTPQFAWLRTRVCPLALLLAALAGGCGAESPQARPPRTVGVALVADPSTPLRAPLPGRAQAAAEVDLGFEVAGQMLKRPARMGDRVEAGDVLAQLDLRDFEAELARARALRDDTRVLLHRVRQAARSGAVSAQDLSDAEARAQEAEARFAIRAKALRDATLRAPFDGVVAATYVETDQQVGIRQPILRLLDRSRIEMWVLVPESAIALVPYLEAVSVRFQALPGRAFPARVGEIGAEADDRTGAYPVSLVIEQPAGRPILPGMAGEARGRLRAGASPSAGPRVPLSALFSGADGSTYVWLLDDSGTTVTRHAVQTGPLTDAGIVVRKGVEPGQRIVVQGTQFLSEGSRVRVLQQGGSSS